MRLLALLLLISACHCNVDCNGECRNDRGCPPGERCFSNSAGRGFCALCVDDSCAAPNVCLSRSVGCGCRNDAHCEAPEVCADGECILECVVDSDCGDGAGCHESRCRSRCECDAECGASFCSREGLCGEPFSMGRTCVAPDASADANVGADSATDGGPDGRPDASIDADAMSACFALAQRTQRCGEIPEPVDACVAREVCEGVRTRGDVARLAPFCWMGLSCDESEGVCRRPERLGLATSAGAAACRATCLDDWRLCPNVDCEVAHWLEADAEAHCECLADAVTCDDAAACGRCR
ncbi:MAG: hypothetical protein AAGE52_18020 [Myxococcota bacterium]